jgi:hypothetical protein
MIALSKGFQTSRLQVWKKLTAHFVCDPIRFYRFYSEVLSNLSVESPADSSTPPFPFHVHGEIVIASISSAG